MNFRDIEKFIIKNIGNNQFSERDLTAFKRLFSKKYQSPILQNSEILQEYKRLFAENIIKKDVLFEGVLRTRSVRTLSGIAAVTVITQNFGCPANCSYCPTQDRVPKSYLKSEPAVMRAIRCEYHPYVQVQTRLLALENNGHDPSKIELIVAGGTWSALPRLYQYWFIKECFKAANDFFSGKNVDLNNKDCLSSSFDDYKKENLFNLKIALKKEQEKNSNESKYKIIGLTLETRPDFIGKRELIRMRELGCTRVEIGVQILDSKVLKHNNRGHGIESVVKATKFLKEWSFKITYHIMVNLPGADLRKDLQKFKLIFSDERFRPDQIKFYPTVVVKDSLLYKWWINGEYLPYNDVDLYNLIIDCKKVIPKYVRVIRLIRDIPGGDIIAGNKITNLRQILQNKGAICGCIRCREPKNQSMDFDNLVFKTIKYKASGGYEYFLSYESLDGKYLYGFCRLRLQGVDDKKLNIPNVLRKAALIRELHVYGSVAAIDKKGNIQHRGLGRRLIARAEKIAKKYSFKKMSVISGIGVRGYYQQFGYCLQDGYMVKQI